MQDSRQPRKKELDITKYQTLILRVINISVPVKRASSIRRITKIN